MWSEKRSKDEEDSIWMLSGVCAINSLKPPDTGVAMTHQRAWEGNQIIFITMYLGLPESPCINYEIRINSKGILLQESLCYVVFEVPRSDTLIDDYIVPKLTTS